MKIWKPVEFAYIGIAPIRYFDHEKYIPWIKGIRPHDKCRCCIRVWDGRSGVELLERLFVDRVYNFLVHIEELTLSVYYFDINKHSQLFFNTPETIVSINEYSIYSISTREKFCEFTKKIGTEKIAKAVELREYEKRDRKSQKEKRFI